MVKYTCILYLGAAHLKKEMQKVEDLTTVIQLGVLFTVTHFLTLPIVVTGALHGSAHIAGCPSDSFQDGRGPPFHSVIMLIPALGY